LKNNKRSIELKNLHSLDDAMRDFSRSTRLDLHAPKIGTTANVLRNKLNPDQEFHKLSLLEAVNLSANTGDVSLLRAALRMLDMDCYSLEGSVTSDKLIHQVLRSTSASGNVASIFDKANEDAVIDEVERQEIIEAAQVAIQKFKTMIATLEQRGRVA